MMTGASEAIPTADEFLFGRGVELKDYFIERTPFSEMVCFENDSGRVFDLAISSPELKSKVIARLIELDVRVVDRT